MGIHYLTTFVHQHFNGWKRNQIKGKLIIDGHSLSYALFEECSTAQSKMYGGDYVSSARYIDNFFKTLVEAGINPLVVLDGIDPDDKADMIANRTKERLNNVIHQFTDEAQPISDGLRHKPIVRSHARPLLSLDVVINSVKRVLGEDHLLVSDSDADVDIACLAIHHQCPVLNNDSDFYAYPLLYGYIPYSKFRWRNAENNIIYGDIYSYQLFCEQFGIRDPSLLTIIPVIVGSDTRTQLDEKQLQIIMPEEEHYTGNVIENAVKYVANFSTFEACLSTLRKKKLFGMISSIQDAYREYFFLPLFKPRNSLATLLHCRDGTPLPELILKKYRKGNLYSFVIDALYIEKVNFKVVVEDILSESWCRLIGVPIRKAIYGILCGSGVCILETQRCKRATSYEEVEIQSIAHITYDGKQIPLPTLQSCGSEVETEHGRKILFGVLDATFEKFESIPKDYQLLLAITRYWYKHCTIDKKHFLLKSFLLLLQLSKEHKMERYKSTGTSTNPAFRIASFAHAFAQWQSIYHDIYCLDQLLHEPLKLLPVSDFLECSLLYSLVEDVMKRDISRVMEKYSLNQNTHRVFLTASY